VPSGLLAELLGRSAALPELADIDHIVQAEDEAGHIREQSRCVGMARCLKEDSGT